MELRPKTPPSPAVVDRATPAGKLAAALQAGRRYVPVAVPRTEPAVRGKLRRLTRSEEEQVSLELGDWLKRAAARGAPPPERQELVAQEQLRTIALAVRRAEGATGDADPEPLADVTEWERCDESQIAALWAAYCDLVDATSVIPTSMTPEQRAEIEAAVRGKDETRLRSFGADALTGYLLSSASPPPTSPTT